MVDPRGRPLWHSELGFSHQSLYFDNEWPVAFHHNHQRIARLINTPPGKKYFRRIGDFLQAIAGHLPYSNFIYRPEAVLGATQNPEIVLGFSFEV